MTKSIEATNDYTQMVTENWLVQRTSINNQRYTHVDFVLTYFWDKNQRWIIRLGVVRLGRWRRGCRTFGRWVVHRRCVRLSAPRRIRAESVWRRSGRRRAGDRPENRWGEYCAHGAPSRNRRTLEGDWNVENKIFFTIKISRKHIGMHNEICSKTKPQITLEHPIVLNWKLFFERGHRKGWDMDMAVVRFKYQEVPLLLRTEWAQILAQRYRA